MNMAFEFIEMAGDKLSHMHVSGEGGGIFHHFPVCISGNKDAIEKVLRAGVSVPIILEGLMKDGYEELARRELEYFEGLGLYR